MKKMHCLIASVPEKENCVCELYHDGIQWGQIEYESTTPNIIIYNNPENDSFEINFIDFVDFLNSTKERYLNFITETDNYSSNDQQ